MENRGCVHIIGRKNETEKKKNHVIKQKGKGIVKSSASVLGNRRKKKLLIKRVFDYLTSDSYLYAPLLHHPANAGSHNSLLPNTGPLDYIKRVTSKILTRPTTEKDQQVSDQGHHQAIGDDHHPENLVEQEDDEAINVNQPEAEVHGVGREEAIGHPEIVKRIVHQSDVLLSRAGRCVDNSKDFLLTHKSSKEIGRSIKC